METEYPFLVFSGTIQGRPEEQVATMVALKLSSSGLTLSHDKWLINASVSAVGSESVSYWLIHKVSTQIRIIPVNRRT